MDYLSDPLLRQRYEEITDEANKHCRKKVPLAILMGSGIDVTKLVSSMTLFAAAAGNLLSLNAVPTGAVEMIQSIFQSCTEILSYSGRVCDFTKRRVSSGWLVYHNLPLYSALDKVYYGAAGVIIYNDCPIDGNLYILLGFEGEKGWCHMLGGLDDHEFVVDCAVREMHEESAAAYKMSAEELIRFPYMPDANHALWLVPAEYVSAKELASRSASFKANGVKAFSEMSEYVWANLEDVSANLHHNEKFEVRTIVQGETKQIRLRASALRNLKDAREQGALHAVLRREVLVNKVMMSGDGQAS